MLNKPALDILTPQDNRQAMRVSIQNHLMVIEFQKDVGWIALTREETIQLIKMLSELANRMVI